VHSEEPRVEAEQIENIPLVEYLELNLTVKEEGPPKECEDMFLRKSWSHGVTLTANHTGNYILQIMWRRIGVAILLGVMELLLRGMLVAFSVQPIQ